MKIIRSLFCRIHSLPR